MSYARVTTTLFETLYAFNNPVGRTTGPLIDDYTTVRFRTKVRPRHRYYFLRSRRPAWTAKCLINILFEQNKACVMDTYFFSETANKRENDLQRQYGCASNSRSGRRTDKTGSRAIGIKILGTKWLKTPFGSDR